MSEVTKTKDQLLTELAELRDQMARLRAAEARLAKIFEYTNDAILLIDVKRDRILDVNPKACSMLGYSREELTAMGISDIHPGEMPALLAFAESVLEGGAGWTDELTCMTKSHAKLPAEISSAGPRPALRFSRWAVIRFQPAIPPTVPATLAGCWGYSSRRNPADPGIFGRPRTRMLFGGWDGLLAG